MATIDPDTLELYQRLVDNGADPKSLQAGVRLTQAAKQRSAQPENTGLPPGPEVSPPGAAPAAPEGMSPDRMELLRALLQRVMAARQAQGAGGAQPPAPAPPVVGRNVSPIIPRVTGMEQPLVLR